MKWKERKPIEKQRRKRRINKEVRSGKMFREKNNIGGKEGEFFFFWEKETLERRFRKLFFGCDKYTKKKKKNLFFIL